MTARGTSVQRFVLVMRILAALAVPAVLAPDASASPDQPKARPNIVYILADHQLGKITVPILAVWGAQDRTLPVKHADLLVQAVKQGRRVVAGGSHAPYMSDPETFHQELLRFLADLLSHSRTR